MPFTTATEPREQILQAAAALFFERGFAAASLNAIGQRIGVSGPAIYTHFKNKDEILATLALEGIERALDRAGQPLSDPRADLAHLVQSHVDEILEDRTLAAVYVTEGKALRPELDDPIAAGLVSYVARWVNTVQLCWPNQTSDRVLTAVNAAMGITYSVVLWDEAALETPGVAEMLVAMTFRALSVLDDPA